MLPTTPASKSSVPAFLFLPKFYITDMGLRHGWQHSNVIPPVQYATIQDSINLMIEDLDRAKFQSADIPDAEPVEATYTLHTGERGRPRIEIDEDVLRVSYALRGPTELAKVFGVSARLIRRRALELGLAEPGEAVYVDLEDEDGNTHRYYTSSTSSQSALSDSELDEIMSQILNSFPSFGRRMIDGHLKYLGHQVPRARIQQSYARVHGPPVSAFGVRRIQRRVYNVKGYNSLCHHDGQHGKKRSSEYYFN